MGGEYNFPYITDGLIDMWDAEWNIGFMEHSTNATTWKDLGSAGNDLIMRSGENYYSWEINRLRCEGKGHVAFMNQTYPNFQTIECVFSVDDIDNDGTEDMQMPVWALNTKGVMATAYRRNNVYLQCGNNSQSMDVGSKANFNGIIHQCAATYGSLSNTSVSKNFYKGIQKTPFVNSGNAAGGDYFTVGGQSGDQRPVKGYIYTIRLYNRALSDSEIEQNWLLDKQRFRIE